MRAVLTTVSQEKREEGGRGGAGGGGAGGGGAGGGEEILERTKKHRVPYYRLHSRAGPVEALVTQISGRKLVDIQSPPGTGASGRG